MIDFGFNCHTPDCSAGISVPLLSVDLASLMAIFRSEDVAKSVRVDALTVLIKEAGKALLDPRLASVPAGSDLDEATSTQVSITPLPSLSCELSVLTSCLLYFLQMVRAINKVRCH